MKVLLGLILIAFIAAIAYAETSNISPAKRCTYTNTARDAAKHSGDSQAERGVKNILFGWTDIPRSIIKTTMDTRNPVWGLAAGTFNGIGKAFPRTVSGISDVMTSPATYFDDMPVQPDNLNTHIR